LPRARLRIVAVHDEAIGVDTDLLPALAGPIALLAQASDMSLSGRGSPVETVSGASAQLRHRPGEASGC
jgi:hypothetical protein